MAAWTYSSGVGGAGAVVGFFDADRTERFRTSVFGGSFTDSTRVAAADFNGDGVADLARTGVHASFAEPDLKARILAEIDAYA